MEMQIWPLAYDSCLFRQHQYGKKYVIKQSYI